MDIRSIKKLAVLFFLSQIGFAQTNMIDSLSQSLKIEKSDTSKVNTLNRLSYQYSLEGNYENAMKYAREAMDLAKKSDWEKGIAASFVSIGSSFDDQGDFQQALKNYSEALNIYEKLGNKQSVGVCLGNIGTVYEVEGNYSQALEYYFKSLKIIEDFGDKKRLAITLSNIGNIYMGQGDFSKSLSYLFKALKITEDLGEKKGIAANLTNIGNVYYNKGEQQEALEYYLKALKISEEIKEMYYTSVLLGNIGGVYDDLNDNSKALEFHFRALALNTKMGRSIGIANNLTNIGSIYKQQGDYEKALQHYFESLKLDEKTGRKTGLVVSWCHIGSVYIKQKNYKLAQEYLSKSLALSREIMSKVDISIAYSKLALLDSVTGNYKSAFQNYRMHILYRDSLNDEEAQRKGVQIAMQYEFDKKQSADSILFAQERKINAIKFEEEKSQRIFLYIGLALIILFAGFIYNRFRISQKQKKIIEQKEKETQQQKYIIEEKHKEIRDSINYAERIQRSLLASDELLSNNLPGSSPVASNRERTASKNYFTYFKPKDVVSGDFYWAGKLTNNNFALITADSTGHGVPGAIMSILNIACLNEAIKEGHIEPDIILNETRKKVIEVLKRDGSEAGGKDGMDCSLLVFETAVPAQGEDSKILVHIASAYNPVWIIRSENQDGIESKRMIEIKADKMPVGKHDHDHVPFSKHTVELYRGDVIYTLTDGFPDQFGGKLGKKYMIRNLKETLLKISHLPMDEQYHKLASEFSEWKGGTEQVDDVTIIGIRI